MTSSSHLNLVHPAPGPVSTQATPAVPDIGRDVVRAFHYCLQSQALNAEVGMDLANLMLELASLHQFAAMQKNSSTPAEAVNAHLKDCEARIAELSAALQLKLPLGQPA